MTVTRRFRDWTRRRAVEAELSRFDDRTLLDAGIPRWRIREIARGAPIEPRLVA